MMKPERLSLFALFLTFAATASATEKEDVDRVLSTAREQNLVMDHLDILHESDRPPPDRFGRPPGRVRVDPRPLQELRDRQRPARTVGRVPGRLQPRSGDRTDGRAVGDVAHVRDQLLVRRDQGRRQRPGDPRPRRRGPTRRAQGPSPRRLGDRRPGHPRTAEAAVVRRRPRPTNSARSSTRPMPRRRSPG